jgi:hypothetical protein
MKLKNIIHNILKEEVSKILNEDITSGSAIVYHRTGKGGYSPVEGIAADGFRVGNGAAYGIGVYTTYNLKSQLTDYMKIYGNIIIECKVNSLDKFLIFDYDIAKKVYGERNYTLDNQLRLILGNEWKEYKNNEILKKLIEEIPKLSYTSEVAKPFYDEFRTTIIKKLRGLVFRGAHDGNVLISYDRENVKPIRYSEDDGKTWKNILNKNIYQRTKRYNPKKSIYYQHILNKIDTKNMDKSDYEFIEKNIDFFIDKIDNHQLKILIEKSKNPYELVKLIINIKGDKLDSDEISYLMGYFENTNEIAKLIINAKGNSLDSNEISYLIINSENPYEIAKLIGIDRVNKTMPELNSDNMLIPISYHKNPYEMAKIIGIDRVNKAISELNSYDMGILVLDSENKDKMVKLIINAKGDVLDKNDMFALIKYSWSPYEMAKIIGIDRVNKAISELNSDDMGILIQDSLNPNELAKLIINAKGDALNSDDKEKMKNLLIQSGVDRSLIPNY